MARAPATPTRPARRRSGDGRDGGGPTHTLAGGPSGCRIIVEENHDLPLVRLSYTLLTGGASDPAGREGLAFFATELACRGAGGRSREEIDETLEALGADLAVSADADSITFDVEVLSRNLEPALDVLCDVLLRPDLREDEADKLRREMHAALDDLRDEDGQLARRFFGRHLYGAHPYGRPLGGTAESIERLTVAEARRFLERMVFGANLIVGAAGDVDERLLRERLARRLSVLRRDGEPSAPLPPLRVPRGLDVLVVDKPERTQSQLLLGQPAVRRTEPDYLPLVVATTAFGGTFTARLMTEVRVKRGLSYGASCRVGQGRGAKAVAMAMAPQLSQTAETLALVLDLWKDFVEGGLRDEEVEFAKEHLAASFAFQVTTPEDRVDLRIGVEVCGLPADFLATLVPHIRAVTPAMVRGAMKRVLRPGDLAVTLVATASEVVPQLEKAKLVRKGAVKVVGFESY